MMTFTRVRIQLQQEGSSDCGFLVSDFSELMRDVSDIGGALEQLIPGGGTMKGRLYISGFGMNSPAWLDILSPRKITDAFCTLMRLPGRLRRDEEELKILQSAAARAKLSVDDSRRLGDQKFEEASVQADHTLYISQIRNIKETHSVMAEVLSTCAEVVRKYPELRGRMESVTAFCMAGVVSLAGNQIKISATSEDAGDVPESSPRLLR